MDKLIKGYQRFRTEQWPQQRSTLEALARDGQTPHTLAIACSDSRVAPEMIFDCGPGEIFTIRNVAALVPPYAPDMANHGTSAALEFGVKVLKVQRIAVIGHSSCGGVHALLHDAPPDARDFIANWMCIAAPAKPRAEAIAGGDAGALRKAAEIETVRVSLDNLMTFPWIAEAHAAGHLFVQGFHFDIGTGTLERILPDGGLGAP
ncbi:MAG TPA: carbonic anhydrase [Acidiphilium sp.]